MKYLCDNCSPKIGCTNRFENKKTECDSYVPMNNEQFIRFCDTEQLVHVIHLMTSCCYVCGKDGVDYKRCYFHKKCTGPKEIEEWLKQPHTTKE